MTFYTESNTNNNLMKINANNFFEIVGIARTVDAQDSGDLAVSTFYNVAIKVRLEPVQIISQISHFKKLVVSIKRKISDKPEKINTSYLNKLHGLDLRDIPAELENKLYAGLQLVQDSYDNNDGFELIDSKEIIISTTAQELKSFYQVAELNVQKDNPPATASTAPTANVENFLERVNETRTDTSEAIEELISTPVDIFYKPEISNYYSSKLGAEKGSFYAAVIKYFLDEVPRLQSSNTYKLIQSQKRLNYVEYTTTLKLNTLLHKQQLKITFDLYKKDENIPTESLETDLNVKRHFDAFEIIKRPPIVTEINGLQFPTVGILIKDKEENGKISYFNVYIKYISKKGEVKPYELIRTIENNLYPGSAIEIKNIRLQDNFAIIRVVPADISGKESNVFTNLVIGKSHLSINKTSIICKNIIDASSIEITVYNISKNTSKLTLWKRSVSPGNFNGNFIEAEEKIVNANNTIITFTDTNPSSYMEYYVSFYTTKSEAVKEFTDVVLISNRSFSVTSNDVSVSLTNQITVNDTVSFELNTSVKHNENKRLYDLLTKNKELKELYDTLLNPSNSNNMRDDNKPLYADLYIHKIVRTDINTGELSTFDLITDGNFSDDNSSRSKNNISPINPQHSYVYQVFTYEKNPETLLKNYVKKVSKDGKSFYYHPYKWNNSEINGTLTMPKTDGEDLPIVNFDDNLTSNLLGEKARIEIKGSGLVDFASITNVTHTRIDRNTIKIEWEINVLKYSNSYDSFVVLKEVNGFRSIVGKTKSNYIYHELKEIDVGSVYYTVIPITLDYNIDAPGHSEIFVLEPEGIVEPRPIIGIIPT